VADRPELLLFDGQVLRHEGEAWSRVDGFYAVLGHPVAHSLSPVFQNAALAACGIDVPYLRLDVHPDRLDALVAAAPDFGLLGGNVTAPLKEETAKRCVRLTGDAAGLGAVNTFKVAADGWKGHNTDHGGLVDVLEREGVSAGWRGLVLGAGGAARAAVCALLDLQVDPVVVSAREGASAERMAAWSASDPEALGRVLLTVDDPPPGGDGRPLAVVCCLPAGVVGSVPEPSPGAAALFVDLRYGDAAVTPTGADWICRDGLGLLLAQGARSFEWLFDVDAPRDVMSAALTR